MKQLCKKGGALCLAVALLLTLLAGCQGETEQSTGETPQDTHPGCHRHRPGGLQRQRQLGLLCRGRGERRGRLSHLPTVIWR